MPRPPVTRIRIRESLAVPRDARALTRGARRRAPAAAVPSLAQRPGDEHAVEATEARRSAARPAVLGSDPVAADAGGHEARRLLTLARAHEHAPRELPALE